MLTVLGGLAEFERDLIRARTAEGRERAKARASSLDSDQSSPRTSRQKHGGGATAARRRQGNAGQHRAELQCQPQHDFEACIMIVVASLMVSILALAVSVVTAWLTLFRRGQILMTQPTVIYFGPDGSGYSLEPKHQKVFLRTLLYSTGRRGHIIENMFVRLQRGETRQNFSIWAYGDDHLARGSGLFVPEGGVVTNHHFLPPPDVGTFVFASGKYSLEVFIKPVGRAARSIFLTALEVSPDDANALRQSNSGMYFDWGPDAGVYHCHVRPPPPRIEMPPFFEQLIRDQAPDERGRPDARTTPDGA